MERFEVSEVDPYASPRREEIVGLWGFCSSRVFKRLDRFRIKALMLPVFVVIALLCFLTGAKWVAKPTHEHRIVGPLLLVIGALLLVPSIYMLADLLGVINGIAEDLHGKRPFVRSEDDYDSQLEQS